MRQRTSEAPGGSQQVRVELHAYGIPGDHWCRVNEIVAGDAATYPVRVWLPEPHGGIGQFRREEVLEWRS